MNNNVFILIFSLLLGSCILLQSRDSIAQDFEPEKFNPAQFEEYERQLNALLKTRRDEEKTFVKEVVDKIRKGKIPSKLVSTSYKWVANRRPTTNYPFVYFERVLRLQAKKIKIEKEVPAFDYNIYRSRAKRVRTADLIK